MSDLVPASPLSLIGPRFTALVGQPAVRRALPWFGGLATVGTAALAWALLMPAPQRVLYTGLDDGERAGVTAALDQAGIGYSIDNASGALSVDEDAFYQARMLVAADGALAAPESGAQMLDNLPLGASRTLEGERLRGARERELVLTIMEIDGVEAARVHLAQPQKSAFVRDDIAPSASVMVRLARGRQLSDSQVAAVASLVAASVPGLALDAVRIVDQHGRLLSDKQAQGGDDARYAMQARLEDKLRGQLDQLLAPMLGAGNFSSEIQVELEMDQVTTARESYDKQGAVRSETQALTQSPGAGAAGGIPGVLANTPPPATVASPGPPQGTAAPTAPPASTGESNTSRTYELGREVAVAETTPGKVRRLSVAVALSRAALKGGKQADVEQIKALIAAAVGVDPARGDQVAVAVRNFEPVAEADSVFYEAPWFAPVVRGLAALIGVVLVLLLGVRPLLRALRRASETAAAAPPAAIAQHNPARLDEKIGLAKQLVAERPDSAVTALRQMLGHESNAA